ncbi:MAG: amidohydrolase, partial [Propionibacterium sp.]
RHFNIWDPVVITCGHVEAGVARNIIPETATIEATMRAFSKQAQQQLFDMVPRVVTDVAASHGVTANVKLTNLYPATINHDEGAALVAKTATDLFGADHFVEMANPMGAAEDFSLVLEQVPGAFAILPATPPDKDPAQVHGNHSPFALYDDSVLLDAAALLSELATRTLADAN